MKNFKLTNNIAGWIVFLIAATVYLLTIEPTASFWDCGEFISCASRLEVSHPPGYPMFAMLGRVATLFAGNNISKAPMMVNVLSGLCSAFTVLFLFWCITHLARKIIGKKEEYSATETISIIGSGIVGALAFTFSDSFWFSATEAVVFSPSSTFTAAILWSILKWENVADEKYSNRWLVLIAYLMGLSIGIHLLNLLTIPVLALVYYFRKYPVTKKGIIITILILFVVLEVVMYGIVQGIFVVTSWFELLFVNGFGLPYNSGWIFFVILLIVLIVLGIRYTSVKKKVILNTIILCFSVILLGYSSYAMTIIRSNAGTPLNENNPSNLFNLLAYLSRIQYGERPLLYGQYYNAPVIDSKEGSAVYVPKDGKYVVSYHRPDYVYDPQFCTIFPRMFSTEGRHVQAYKDWADIKGTPITITNRQGKDEIVYKPTFGENLKFFFNYQVKWMYFRYFMWNFSGRQNDLQGHGDMLRGNWISGIKFLDEMRLGPQDMLPDNISGYKFKHNKAKNTYYLLPLILGLIGLIFHAKKHKKDFWLVLVLFFMTGLAIVLFLNQKPFEPRERDYSYVGSYFAFAIWIGLGVMALINWVGKNYKGPVIGILTTALCLILVPGIMAHENWDDHDRSGRYTCTDFAYDYLNSCEKNGIIFTNGDNDTFPLWCAQEAMGIRPDVRVVILSYLSADWFIEQMQHKVNESDPLPFSMTKDKYQDGTRDAVYIVDRIKDYVPLKKAIDFLASDNPETKTLPNVPERVDYLPASKFSLKIDAAKVLANGTVTPEYANSIVPEMKWQIKRNIIYKSDMMILDILANNDWNRPIYFAMNGPDESYQGLQKYLRLDGFGYRLVPVEYTRPDGQYGSIDTKILYNNLMNKFKWGNIDNPKVYLDENNMRMITSLRNNFARLAEHLIDENKNDSALLVLDKSFKIMPVEIIPLNYFALPLIEQYYRVKQFSKANDLTQKLFENVDQELKYYASFKGSQINSIDGDKRICFYTLDRLGKVAEFYGQKELGNKIRSVLQGYVQTMGLDQQNN